MMADRIFDGSYALDDPSAQITTTVETSLLGTVYHTTSLSTSLIYYSTWYSIVHVCTSWIYLTVFFPVGPLRLLDYLSAIRSAVF